MDMQPTIFTKIINGDIPAYKIYEDDKTIAFLDINPVRYGHTLVVPKVQVDQYIDLADDDYQALWQSVKKVAKHLRDVLQTERVGVAIKGTDVPHVHVHLMPFNEGQALYHNDTSPKLTPKEYAELADKLRF